MKNSKDLLPLFIIGGLGVYLLAGQKAGRKGSAPPPPSGGGSAPPPPSGGGSAPPPSGGGSAPPPAPQTEWGDKYTKLEKLGYTPRINLTTAVYRFQNDYNLWRGQSLLEKDGEWGPDTEGAADEVITEGWNASTWPPTSTGGQVDPGEPIIETDPEGPTQTGPVRAVALEASTDSDYSFIDNTSHTHNGPLSWKNNLIDYINYILERRSTGGTPEYRQVKIQLSYPTSDSGNPTKHTHQQVIARSQAEELADGKTIEIQSDWGREPGGDRENHKHQVTLRAILESV